MKGLNKGQSGTNIIAAIQCNWKITRKDPIFFWSPGASTQALLSAPSLKENNKAKIDSYWSLNFDINQYK